MCAEGQKQRIVNRLIAFPACHRRLAIVLALLRAAFEAVEGFAVPGHQCIKVVAIIGLVELAGARTQHIRKHLHLLHESRRVRYVVQRPIGLGHLAGAPRWRLQARLGCRLRPHLAHVLFDCGVATSEALAIATKAGLSPKKVIEVLQVSSGRSWASDFKFPNYVLTRTFEDGFRLELLEKDLQIFTKLAQDLKAPAFIANTVMQIISLASSQGYSKRGHTSIAEFIEQLAGVTIEN